MWLGAVGFSFRALRLKIYFHSQFQFVRTESGQRIPLKTIISESHSQEIKPPCKKTPKY